MYYRVKVSIQKKKKSLSLGPSKKKTVVLVYCCYICPTTAAGANVSPDYEL